MIEANETPVGRIVAITTGFAQGTGVNIVVAILVIVELAAVFGKGAGFAIGILFLGFIFIPILGFGSATYIGKRPAMG